MAALTKPWEICASIGRRPNEVDGRDACSGRLAGAAAWQPDPAWCLRCRQRRDAGRAAAAASRWPAAARGRAGPDRASTPGWPAQAGAPARAAAGPGGSLPAGAAAPARHRGRLSGARPDQWPDPCRAQSRSAADPGFDYQAGDRAGRARSAGPGPSLPHRAAERGQARPWSAAGRSGAQGERRSGAQSGRSPGPGGAPAGGRRDQGRGPLSDRRYRISMVDRDQPQPAAQCPLQPGHRRSQDRGGHARACARRAGRRGPRGR